ncbi:hypothetical protein BT67DRAFT_7676 [Trichocladium antarcticum]|uniref:Uncharacterized protein n=1 Tax=Trichocladium antarcticum TaxID=1450529 RepID=A0AAN6USR8_9PEZI|nr:hypothetical protein BT67DRAFT_7676 [Trichocladium antarcticum]
MSLAFADEAPQGLWPFRSSRGIHPLHESREAQRRVKVSDSACLVRFCGIHLPVAGHSIGITLPVDANRGVPEPRSRRLACPARSVTAARPLICPIATIRENIIFWLPTLRPLGTVTAGAVMEPLSAGPRGSVSPGQGRRCTSTRTFDAFSSSLDADTEKKSLPTRRLAYRSADRGRVATRSSQQIARARTWYRQKSWSWKRAIEINGVSLRSIPAPTTGKALTLPPPPPTVSPWTTSTSASP